MEKNAVESVRTLTQFADFNIKQARRCASEVGAEDVDTRVAEGDPAREIIAFANDRKADLIVIGSRGFSTLKSLALGSTSNNVAQLADCTCLTVK